MKRGSTTCLAAALHIPMDPLNLRGDRSFLRYTLFPTRSADGPGAFSWEIATNRRSRRSISPARIRTKRIMFIFRQPVAARVNPLRRVVSISENMRSECKRGRFFSMIRCFILTPSVSMSPVSLNLIRRVLKFFEKITIFLIVRFFTELEQK